MFHSIAIFYWWFRKMYFLQHHDILSNLLCMLSLPYFTIQRFFVEFRYSFNLAIQEVDLRILLWFFHVRYIELNIANVHQFHLSLSQTFGRRIYMLKPSCWIKFPSRILLFIRSSVASLTALSQLLKLLLTYSILLQNIRYEIWTL